MVALMIINFPNGNLLAHNIFISEKHILPHAEVFKDLGTK